MDSFSIEYILLIAAFLGALLSLRGDFKKEPGKNQKKFLYGVLGISVATISLIGGSIIKYKDLVEKKILNQRTAGMDTSLKALTNVTSNITSDLRSAKDTISDIRKKDILIRDIIVNDIKTLEEKNIKGKEELKTKLQTSLTLANSLVSEDSAMESRIDGINSSVRTVQTDFAAYKIQIEKYASDTRGLFENSVTTIQNALKAQFSTLTEQIKKEHDHADSTLIAFYSETIKSEKDRISELEKVQRIGAGKTDSLEGIIHSLQEKLQVSTTHVPDSAALSQIKQ